MFPACPAHQPAADAKSCPPPTRTPSPASTAQRSLRIAAARPPPRRRLSIRVREEGLKLSWNGASVSMDCPAGLGAGYQWKTSCCSTNLATLRYSSPSTGHHDQPWSCPGQSAGRHARVNPAARGSQRRCSPPDNRTPFRHRPPPSSIRQLVCRSRPACPCRTPQRRH